MDKEKAGKDIMELFLRIINKYNSLEKLPARYGSKSDLYHSERHLLDKIGDKPGRNITGLAEVVGMTKGAISQFARKLEAKRLIQRYKKSTNNKEVFIELTKAGRDIYKKRIEINKETIVPLVEELKRHPDDQVIFLVSMFHWLDAFMDQARSKMKMHKLSGS